MAEHLATPEPRVTWRKDLEAQIASLTRARDAAVAAATAWEGTANMYANAWKRELNGFIWNKRHLVDALVLGTRDVTSKVRQAEAFVSAIRQWKHDASVARTLGVPEPSLLEYLPPDNPMSLDVADRAPVTSQPTGDANC